MRKVIGAIVATLLAAGTARADFSAGWESYEKADFFGAARAWLPLAEEGDARAQYALAILLLRGRGFDRNAAGAAVLLAPAAAAGHPEAAYALAILYQDGDGVRADRREAARLYRIAADAGYGPAQNNLGLLYALGDGIAKDALAAHVWFSLAARGGDEGAVRNRDRMALELNPAQTVESARRLQAWTQPATPMVQSIAAAMYPGGAEVVEQIGRIVAPPASPPVLEATMATTGEPTMEPEVAAMDVPSPPAVAAAPVEVVAPTAPLAIEPAPAAIPAGPPLRILPR